MGHLTMITGGAKSGKSSTAQNLIKVQAFNRVAYIATQANQFNDEESQAAILRHQEDRPRDWATYEVFRDLDKLIAEDWDYQACIIDCLSLWLTNQIFYYQEEFGFDADFDQLSSTEIQHIQAAVEHDLESLIKAIHQSPCRFWVVSNEVGQGIVPNSQLSRFFRNLQGRLNQMLAAKANNVYWVVSGIPVQIKGGK